MPFPLNRPLEKNRDKIISLQPWTEAKENFFAEQDKYLTSDLEYWLRDLKNRKQEGIYYLNHITILESANLTSGKSDHLSKLVRKELPALYNLIKNQLQVSGPGKLDKVRILQQKYFRLCKRFDKIRLFIVEDIDQRPLLSIY